MMNRSAKTRAVADPALWRRRQILGEPGRNKVCAGGMEGRAA